MSLLSETEKKKSLISVAKATLDNNKISKPKLRKHLFLGGMGTQSQG